MPTILENHLHIRSIVTRRSILPPPGSTDDPDWGESWDYLCRLYTPAMVRYVRHILERSLGRPVDLDEAADVVQDYLSQAMEKGWLSRDRDDIRCFRAYLQTQLSRHAVSHVRRQHAQKRRPAVMEPAAALESVAAREEDLSAELDAGWVEAIRDHVLGRLEASNRTYHAVILDLLNTDGQGSDDLVERLGRPAARTKDLRYRARRRFALLFFEECRVSVRDEEAYEGLIAHLRDYLP